MACGILVTWPGIESVTSVLEAQSLNHWLAKNVPIDYNFECKMVEQHHQINWHKFEHTPGDSGGQGGQAGCSSQGREELNTN